MLFRLLLLFLSIGVFFNSLAYVDTNTSINVTSLDNNGIAKWEHKVFSNSTTYQIVEHKNRVALKAVSENSASGLVLKKRIDLLQTPFMHWSWLVQNKLAPLNEQSKAGDDYIARVYVVIDGGLMAWTTKCLNYVWSSHQAKGQVWNNAYAGSNVKMISVRGKLSLTQQWYEEKRNVYQDLIDHFGDKGSDKKNQKAYRYIDIVAIMTDTDNSHGQAESYYGDIVFSSK